MLRVDKAYILLHTLFVGSQTEMYVADSNNFHRLRAIGKGFVDIYVENPVDRMLITVMPVQHHADCQH